MSAVQALLDDVAGGWERLLAALRDEQALIRLDGNHVYWREKKRKAGVTGAIKVKDAPALDQWKVRVQVEGTARAAFHNRPAFGESEQDYIARMKALAAEQLEADRLADEAAKIGVDVHGLIEYEVRRRLGLPAERPSVCEEAAFRFAGWKEWAASVNLVPLAAEAKVHHREHDYCGTADLLAFVDGRATVIDWKPTPKVYEERRLQLAAYAEALRSMGWPALDRAVVCIPRDGGDISMLPVDPSPEAREETFKAFLSCLSLYRWLASLRRGA